MANDDEIKELKEQLRHMEMLYQNFEGGQGRDAYEQQIIESIKDIQKTLSSSNEKLGRYDERITSLGRDFSRLRDETKQSEKENRKSIDGLKDHITRNKMDMSPLMRDNKTMRAVVWAVVAAAIATVVTWYAKG